MDGLLSDGTAFCCCTQCMYMCERIKEEEETKKEMPKRSTKRPGSPSCTPKTVKPAADWTKAMLLRSN